VNKIRKNLQIIQSSVVQPRSFLYNRCIYKKGSSKYLKTSSNERGIFMEMNMYMEISVILFLIFAFSFAHSIFKGTNKRVAKIITATFISLCSFVIVWRVASLLSYFD